MTYQIAVEEIGFGELRRWSAVTGGPRTTTWVATIVDKSPRFGFEREFLAASYDWSGSSSNGNRGIKALYLLDDDIIYEVHNRVSWSRSDRYFCRYQDGELRRLAKAEVMAEVYRSEYRSLAAAAVQRMRFDAKQSAQPIVDHGRKMPIGIDVLTAARARMAWAFEQFPRLYLSFSAGKDSTVMLQLAAEEARKRKRKIGVLLVDLEAQYAETIKHALAMFVRYQDVIEPYWISLPISLRNAVSIEQTHWRCWDPAMREAWVRQPPAFAITDGWELDFFTAGMEFEDFVEAFGKWYSRGELTGCMVGIRSDESLNRYVALTRQKATYKGRCWTTRMPGSVYNLYPIYDWKTEDIWTYHARSGNPYNRVYDLMHKADVPLGSMRICQPYGDDQRKGLWLFHLLEPETWAKVVERVAGANSGALHCRDVGNMQGVIQVSKPDGYTWQGYAEFLLETLPPPTAEHYRIKIAAFRKWWEERGYPQGIPDEGDRKKESKKQTPSWRRVCRVLLRNDYWCRGLSFGPHRRNAYESYIKVMRQRRSEWGL